MSNTSINWQPELLEDDLTQAIPLKASDFDRLYAAASDPRIWEGHPIPDRYKREVFRDYFDGGVASGSAFLILDKAKNAVIGSTRYYQYTPEDSSVVLGYTFLACAYWGGLYYKSNKKLMLDYAFQYVDKVYFHIGANNIRSQKALAKIGGVKIDEMYLEYTGRRDLYYKYLIMNPNVTNR